MLQQDFTSKGTFSEKYMYALHLSYATLVTYVPVLGLNNSSFHAGYFLLFSSNWCEHKGHTVPCKVLGRGFFHRAGSFAYISRQGMTSLELCLQLIPSGQGNQPRRQQPALAGYASPLTLDDAGLNVLYLISCQLRLIVDQ